MFGDIYKLENENIAAAIIPDDGGRLIELTDKRNDRNFIWTNMRTAPLRRYYGANYDNLSAGGVEEAFPSVLAENFNGDEFPFFGEIWSIPWKVENADNRSVTLSCYSSIYPVAVRKQWRVEGDKCICLYSLTNESYKPLPCLFGIHPSFALMQGDRLDMPDGRYTFGVVTPDQNGLNVDSEFDWPEACGRDLSYLRSDIKTMDCIQFHTASMSDGSVRIIGADGHNLHMTYDHTFFTSICVWQIAGGWRGHNTLMVEFFTGWPLKLSEALDAANCLTLLPMQTVETQVVYEISSEL